MQEEAPLYTAGHIFIRSLLGVPADIAWRGETALAERKERKGQVTESWTTRTAFLFGIVVALFPVVLGISVIGDEGEWDSNTDRAIWGTLWLATGALIVAGLLLSRRTYGGGMALVAIGVVGFCLSTFWMAFITLPVGLGLLILAHLRGRVARPSPGTGTV
jgi:hypothetical protein